jgi:hypothetical protein
VAPSDLSSPRVYSGTLKNQDTQLLPASCGAAGESAFLLIQPYSDGARRITVDTCGRVTWNSVISVLEVSDSK